MPMFFRWGRQAAPQYNAKCGHEIAFEADIVVSVYTRAEEQWIGRFLMTCVTA